MPALFFGLLEVSLRVVGVGYPVGFLQKAEQPRLLVDNYKFSRRFFPKALARNSQPILVESEKPNDRRRIVVFGGSAAMGDPEAAYGLPRVLDALFELRFPDLDVEVVNAAVTAINSHVVLPIVKDCRRLDADAWAIYMGNNEVHGPFGAGTVFGGNNTPLWMIRGGLAVKKTKLGQLLAGIRANRGSNSSAPKSWGGMEMFLNSTVARDAPALQRVYDCFEKNLADILQQGRRARVPVVISTVAANLRDCAPFVSQHKSSLSAEQEKQWQVHFDAALAAQSAGQFERASGSFEAAAAIDDQYAELQFRWAQCSRQLGDIPKAQQQFALARDLDALRFRADSKINELIAATARKFGEQGVHFVDGEKLLSQRASDGILGDSYFYEHVHFRFRGNYELAKLYAEAICAAWKLSSDADWASQKACEQRLGLTAYHRRRVEQEVRGRLAVPPFSQQSNHQDQMDRIAQRIDLLGQSMTPAAGQAAMKNFSSLVAQEPTDWLVRKQYGELLESTGNLEAAIRQWQEITKRIPHDPVSFFKLGTLLNRTKKWSAAEQALRTALQLRPEYARASNSLGIALSHLDRIDESYEEFQRAIEVRPSYAEAYYNWGLVLNNQSDVDSAMDKFKLAVDLNPNYLVVHQKLAKHYSGKKKFIEAEPYYAAIVRILPKDPSARINLGFLYINCQQPAKAIPHFEAALEFDSNLQLARQGLAAARRLTSSP